MNYPNNRTSKLWVAGSIPAGDANAITDGDRRARQKRAGTVFRICRVRFLLPFLFAISAAAQQPRFVLTPEVGSADRTAIAAAHSIVMLVWSDTTAVHWQRFDAAGASLDIAPASIRVAFDGTVRDREPMTITSNGSHPAVASDGKRTDNRL